MTFAILRSIVLKILFLAYPGTKQPQLPALDIARGESAIQDLDHAFTRLGSSEEERTILAPIALVWSYYESNWFANPKGSNDQGSACGVMQVHQPWIERPGTTCQDLRSDRILGYEIGILRLQDFITKCGSVRGGLTAYSTNGQCPKPGWAIRLVVNRCKIAGC